MTVVCFPAAETCTYGGVVAFEVVVALGTSKLPVSANMVVGVVNPSPPLGPGAATDWSSTVCTLDTSAVVTTPKLGGISVGLGGTNGVVGPTLGYPVVEHAKEAGSKKPALRAQVTRSSPCIGPLRQQLGGPPDTELLVSPRRSNIWPLGHNKSPCRSIRCRGSKSTTNVSYGYFRRSVVACSNDGGGPGQDWA